MVKLLIAVSILLSALPVAAAFDEITENGCWTSKGCYKDTPKGDSGAFLLTWEWQASTEKVEFELQATLTETQSYVALGLGKSKEMVDLTIISCVTKAVKDPATTEVEPFFAHGKTQPLATLPTETVVTPVSDSIPAARVVNGLQTMSCRFIYDNDEAKKEVKKNSTKWKDLTQEVFVSVAMGEYDSATSLLRKHTTTPRVHTEALVLTTVDSYSTTTTTTTATSSNGSSCPHPSLSFASLSIAAMLSLLTRQ